jgi:hypothetical protein
LRSLRSHRYEGSGYEFYLDVSTSDAATFASQLEHLKSSTWVDYGTRLVSQDFTLYNPAFDFLIWGSHTSEFLPTGDVVPTFTYRIYDEWQYLRVWNGDESNAGVWSLIVAEFVLYLYVLTYMAEEMKELFFWGRKKYVRRTKPEQSRTEPNRTNLTPRPPPGTSARG